ncbi:hypothetical protein [Streptomyces tailanensis]|uniref:hypothetical protein n=1 Tax=Streptomyces tailanensis TaxID=2569858 RepID=UPI00122DE358|nr:hypothetical protein [Streptomyces tailanensis]
MEQRIGSNSQPLAAAAVDPSHIPGLTAPVSVKKEKQEEPEDNKPTESAEPAETAEADEAAPEQEEATEASDEKAADEDAKDSSEDDEDDTDDADDTNEVDDADDADDADDEATDGPVFEASDRRAKIVADSKGVRLKLDDQDCEFRWDEIGAIETESPRFGKRFTVTVHTPDRRWYPIEIEAKAKAEHTEWETRIDEVLDAYFEDGDSAP